MMHIKQTIVFLVLFVLSCAELKPNRNLAIPNGTFELKYSTDQKYLIAASSFLVSVYWGVNGTHIGDLPLASGDIVTTVQLSRTNMMIAIGLIDGTIKLYDVNKDLVPEVINAPENTRVNSLCFSPDDQYLVAGFQNNLIGVYNIEDTSTEYINFADKRVQTVACSPESNIFVAGGGDGNQAKFSMYSVSNNSNAERELLDFVDHPSVSVLGATFSESGDRVYRVGQNGLIYSYQIKSETQYDSLPEIYVGSNATLFNIIASSDEKVLATVNDQNAILLKLNSDLKLYQIYATFQVSSKTVALAPKGSNLVIVGANGTADILGQCNQNYYVNSTGGCSPCSTECILCQDQPKKCFQCVRKFYLKDEQCLTCGVGCQNCSEENNCKECDGPNFVINTQDGNCHCISTRYLDVDQCKLCSQAIDFCTECKTQDLCDLCDVALHRVTSGDKTQCICQSGYFQNSQQLCESCIIQHCLSCKSADVCGSCDQKNNWIINTTTNKCSCRQGFRQQENNCLKCPRGCSQCTAQKCLKCNSNEHYKPTPNPQSNICECNEGYFDNNNTLTCDACILGCSVCNNNETCVTCNKAQHFDKKDEKCVCESSQYYFKDKKCNKCSTSMMYCIQCASQSKCSKCQIGTVSSDGTKCECPESQFIDATTRQCKNCPEQCKECQNQDKCLKCKDGYELDDSNCKSSGVDALIIILIVIGVIFLLAAIFVMIKCIKKKQSRQSYEELD